MFLGCFWCPWALDFGGISVILGDFSWWFVGFGFWSAIVDLIRSWFVGLLFGCALPRLGLRCGRFEWFAGCSACTVWV